MELISNLVFEFNDAQILFGMFQGFKKATPYGGARKLRLTPPPVRRESQGTGSTSQSSEKFPSKIGISKTKQKRKIELKP